MILTRKLQLKIIDVKNWLFLNELNNNVFKAYNDVVNTHYFSTLFKDKIALTDEEINSKTIKINKKLNKNKEIIKEAKDDKKKIETLKKEQQKLYNTLRILNREARDKAEVFYTTGDKNFGYQMLSRKFPEIPSTIRTCINADVYANFTKEINDIRSGKRAVRTYRKGVPIPFQLDKSKEIFVQKNDKIIFRWIKDIDFEIIFGRDKSARQSEVEKIISGDYKMSDSKLQIKNKKIFLLLALNQPEEKLQLDKSVTIGVDLGIVFPAYVSTNSGIQHQRIGSSDDLFKLRMQIQKRRRRLQKDIKSAHGGKGRKKKLKALERLRQKERNYVRTYNHFISREIINFAIQQKAATIFIEDLSGFGKNKEKGNIILRNWSYFELQSMIEYKAKLKGVEVKKVDPKYTSQICSICGEKGKRESQKDFLCLNKKCENFGKKILADYNAAWNIAKGGIKI